MNSYSDSSIGVGGIIVYCYDCTIENTVNMASVAFTRSTSWLYIGGIAGYLFASNKDITVRNCANYGSVTHSGTVSNAYIGGIIGVSEGSSPKYIQSCFNYGAITHNGTTPSGMNIGGILGSAWYGTINLENCVSGGKIVSNSGIIGSVVGYVNSKATTITHCYWTNDVGCDNAYGYGSPIKANETKQASLNTTTANNLNTYNSSWSK